MGVAGMRGGMASGPSVGVVVARVADRGISLP